MSHRLRPLEHVHVQQLLSRWIRETTPIIVNVVKVNLLTSVVKCPALNIATQKGMLHMEYQNDAAPTSIVAPPSLSQRGLYSPVTIPDAAISKVRKSSANFVTRIIIQYNLQSLQSYCSAQKRTHYYRRYE